MPIDTATGPHAVTSIRELLTRFTPVEKDTSDPDNATLTYDILNWTFRPHTPPPAPNRVYGSLVIRRQATPSATLYHIQQKTHIGGLATHLNAEITSDLDDSLQSWTLNTYREDANGDPVPISELREHGRNSSGHIQSQDDTYNYHAQNTVLSHWTLPHLLMRNVLSLPITFDMLQDLSVLRAKQRLIDEGPIDLDSGTYSSFAQTGEGILPTHYLLDDRQRPQLITFGLIAWALTDIV
ncbi:MAG TPA: hypothetical protein EYG11_14510 [Candidatus Latescibacteria bacterium]|nr:hypothetical protein [Candidatus Handelsmanbacteria bacterium]HIL09911.1 hypothetical protein [Candidatus Latescibacterota bacterium]